MALRVLGPVEWKVSGVALDLGPPQQRAALAALLVDVGRPVSTTTLVDRIWNNDPPAAARNALYAHIMRIRRLLNRASGSGSAAWRLDRRPGGYLLDGDRDLVDLHRFRRLINSANASAGTANEPAQARRAELLREALGLWQGVPLADLSGDWVQRVRDGCSRQRLDAMVAWARAESRLGHHELVITEVHGWAEEHPLVEPLSAVLMRALCAAGRPAEALDHYAGVRERLADELGVDPGPELRGLHEAILRGESSVVADPVGTTAVVPAVTRAIDPAQLPLAASGFVGRGDELAYLDAVQYPAGSRSTSMPVAVVTGTAGVGKTALAVQWAHRVADDFPDGQLYVNLRGFEPVKPPMNPAEAVRGLLEALGVPVGRLPASGQAQIGLYRSLLSDRRVLIVLDNARDAEQVRPLLPGAPGCLVVVTSRDPLPGLVATEGARPIPVDLLSTARSRDLVASRIGADRVAAEPEAVAEIIAGCARLPLALAVVSARAVTRPGDSLARLATELRDTRRALDLFASTDPATDLRTVFSWSYRTLRPSAARLFRLLSVWPGEDLSGPAAASLSGVPHRRVRADLAACDGARLVTEHGPDRYLVHDLLRAYAGELAALIDPEPVRRAARHRLLDHYLYTALGAARLLEPGREPTTVAPHRSGVFPEQFADRTRALAWLAAERQGIRTAIELATGEGLDGYAERLAGALSTLPKWHGPIHGTAHGVVSGSTHGAASGATQVQMLGVPQQRRMGRAAGGWAIG